MPRVVALSQDVAYCIPQLHLWLRHMHIFLLQVTPHIAWEQAFYLFGFLGLSWVLLWAIFYEDSHAQPLDQIPFVLPKVRHDLLIVLLCITNCTEKFC